MLLAISIRQVWSWNIALYKFLCRYLNPNCFASLLRRFVFVYKIVRLKWQAWYRKQRYSKPPSLNPGTSDRVESGDQHSKDADVDETVVPLDNISCSLYPYSTGSHDSARSSRILNASRSSHNSGIISRNASLSSQNTNSRPRSPLGYSFTVQPTNPQPTNPRRAHSMPSLELGRPWHPADLPESVIKSRHRVSQISPQPRSSSPVESIELLSPGEISSLHDRTRFRSLIEQPTELPRVGTSSQTHANDLEIPALNHYRIYPVVPEVFQRYQKRRRM